jgi:hypothetical protein
MDFCFKTARGFGLSGCCEEILEAEKGWLTFTRSDFCNESARLLGKPLNEVVKRVLYDPNLLFIAAS